MSCEEGVERRAGGGDRSRRGSFSNPRKLTATVSCATDLNRNAAEGGIARRPEIDEEVDGRRTRKDEEGGSEG